jgi:hypothetical protein
MRKNIFQILGKAQRVGRRRHEAKYGVKNLSWLDIDPIGSIKAKQQFGIEIMRLRAPAPVPKREGIAAITASECVVIRQKAMTPDSRPRSCSSRHGIEADIVTTPGGLELGPGTVQKRYVIVKPTIVEWTIHEVPLIIRFVQRVGTAF